MSVLAQDYPSAPANPSSLAKRDARGCGLNLSCAEKTHSAFCYSF